MGLRIGSLADLEIAPTQQENTGNENMADPAFWRNRRVLLTGHTGFKGAWAALWLSRMGAQVTGISLAPDTHPDLFTLAGVEQAVSSKLMDIRDADLLRQAVGEANPHIIIHMAAQALVRRSYDQPLATLASNIMGTANLLEAARSLEDLQAVLVITSDKVYDNTELNRPFLEGDPLGGHDPYSASKAATELVVSSYRDSFFSNGPVSLVTARGGNVIGGGDFSKDRIVPDIWRAARASEPITLRYPEATRPWQHVLDCLNGYFLYVEKAAASAREPLPAALNFGPCGAATFTVRDLTVALQKALGATQGWQQETGDFPREMTTLSLDTSTARRLLDWQDRLPGELSLEWTAQWYLDLTKGKDMNAATHQQISSYMELS